MHPLNLFKYIRRREGMAKNNKRERDERPNMNPNQPRREEHTREAGPSQRPEQRPGQNPNRPQKEERQNPERERRW